MFQCFPCQKIQMFLLLFPCLFHLFSSLFKNRSQKPFFEVPSADLSSKTWFLDPFWAPSKSQNPPLERHFQPKRRSRLGSPEWGFSSRSQPGHDLVLKTAQRRFGIDFNSFWVDLGCILAVFSAILPDFCWSSVTVSISYCTSSLPSKLLLYVKYRVLFFQVNS